MEKLLREGKANIKKSFEGLLNGGTLHMEIDEQIVYNQLFTKKNAVWSLLLASGYLKVVGWMFVERTGNTCYELALTNKEVHVMFNNMIQDWFVGNDNYKNRESGFGRYDVMLEPRAASAQSSRGTTEKMDAVIIEFKVQDSDEKELSDTVQTALQQIESMNYQANLAAKGIRTKESESMLLHSVEKGIDWGIKKRSAYDEEGRSFFV